jgi:hypothetical protein
MEHNLNQTLAPPLPIGKDHESGREFSRLTLSIIRINGGTQSRAKIDDGVVAEYAEAIDDGVTFPPIVVYYDGNDYWLADGFHRYHATGKAGQSEIHADVRRGRQRDAILHSLGANEEHGLRRTTADKHRAVQTLLDDADWSQWTDVAIAKAARVNRKLVNRLRNDRHMPPGTCEPTSRKYINKHGSESVMQTGNIGPIRPPARTITRTIDREFINDDPDFQASAEESDRDIEIERAERGDPALAAENEELKERVRRLDRRIAALTEESGSWKTKAETWEKRAKVLGWKATADA